MVEGTNDFKWMNLEIKKINFKLILHFIDQYKKSSSNNKIIR